MGGRHACAVGAPPAVHRRLAEMQAEMQVASGPAGAAPDDADLAERLARLRLDELIPPDVVAAICAALLPVLAPTTPAPRGTP